MMNRYSEILFVGPQEASHQSGSLSRRLSAPENTEGIKPEEVDKLFLPFRQIGSGLTRQYDAICDRGQPRQACCSSCVENHACAGSIS
jgi:hypothetical protein